MPTLDDFRGELWRMFADHLRQMDQPTRAKYLYLLIDLVLDNDEVPTPVLRELLGNAARAVRNPGGVA